MRQNAFLPFIRRRRIWSAALAALAVFLIAGALLAQAVEASRDQLNRAYDEMEIDFRLGPGRRRFGNTFSLTLYQLRELVKADWMEGMEASVSVSGTVAVAGAAPGIPLIPVRMLWTADPAGEFGEPAEGEYGSGICVSPSFAETVRSGLGETAAVVWFGSAPGSADLITVRALNPAVPDGTVLCSFDTFDHYVRNMPREKTNLVFGSMTFRVKRERNRDIHDIVNFIQKTVNNTDHPANRNRDVAVYYNEAEIDGIMSPLEEKQASALFFERLFSALLPAAAHVLEAAAALSLSDECGVRRLLGEGRGRVFLSLWIPAAILLSACCLLTAGGLALCGLGAFIRPGTTLTHAGISLALTALVLALLCIVDPLTLLKEKNDE